MKSTATGSHLPSDDELAAALRQAREMQHAPEHLVRRAIDVWREPAPAPVARWLRLLAELRFDSALQPALALGLRSGAGQTARQIVFTCGDHDIDLRVTAEPKGGWVLSGQVLGPLDAPAEVRLWQQPQPPEPEDAPHLQRELGEMGEFRFSVDAPGTYHLVVCVANTWMALPTLELKPSAAT